MIDRLFSLNYLKIVASNVIERSTRSNKVTSKSIVARNVIHRDSSQCGSNNILANANECHALMLVAAAR